MVFFLIWGAAIGLTPAFLSFLSLSEYLGPIDKPKHERNWLKCEHTDVPPPLLTELWERLRQSGAELDCALGRRLNKQAKGVITFRLRQSAMGSLFWVPKNMNSNNLYKWVAKNMSKEYLKAAIKAVQDGYPWFGFGGAYLKLDEKDRKKHNKPDAKAAYLVLFGSRKTELRNSVH